MNSGSDWCVVGSEQWTGFKSAATGYLSYCRDTNLAVFAVELSGLPEPAYKYKETTGDGYRQK
jgi:hypothetical protein